ncbi:MAG: UDP-N-acetylglucosamine 2-epimerase (hydrolyzing) [Proteobacteria bacterium]|nr:UDP-N-acetylglucosamine 2-epimerase (hydrolyzing) [Pseudomonadota bacterium]
MRRVALVSVGRSDYGIQRPLIAALGADPGFELRLIVGGMHLSARYGMSVAEVEADGAPIAARIEAEAEDDSPAATARAMGRGLAGFAEAYARITPDLVVVFGDRFEMFAAAAAAAPFPFPIAHISGGALSEGAIDDSFRHAITKLAHLHFVDCEEARGRVLQMGEAEERVFNVGALGLDALAHTRPMSLAEIGERIGLALSEPPILATLHPVTREAGRSGEYAEAFLAALAGTGLPVVLTYPGADVGAQAIVDRIEGFAAANARAAAVKNLGHQGYAGLMAAARAMVGNSSSGIIEAASFRLPVVDIGPRQKGRMAPANVIRCGHARAEIAAALGRALSPEFRASLASLVNPYGDGRAAPRIVEALRAFPLGATAKPFVERR